MANPDIKGQVLQNAINLVYSSHHIHNYPHGSTQRVIRADNVASQAICQRLSNVLLNVRVEEGNGIIVNVVDQPNGEPTAIPLDAYV